MNANATITTHPVLIADEWRISGSAQPFTTVNPRTRQALGEHYPVSNWSDIDAALTAAAQAAPAMRSMDPEKIALFLERYSAEITKSCDVLVAAAAAETGLAASPRLKDVELPRTVNQLRQAAKTARDGSWRRPTIDTTIPLRSCLAAIGPVWTIGPNNFPFAYNGIAGGDFASAVAAGNPVIAKAHPLHPTTSRLLAELAHQAARATELPSGAVQMIYHLAPEDGLRMVADDRLSAVGFTGSRSGGLKLKAAADGAGKPFFAEMSSVNPVVILPGALSENMNAIADQLTASVTAGTGQFCTKPGLVFALGGDMTSAFIEQVRIKLSAAPVGVLFSEGGLSALLKSIDTIRDAGASVVLGGTSGDQEGFGAENTLLRATGSQFLRNPHAFQTEAFGNATLIISVEDVDQLIAMLKTLDGNLTGSIYSSASGSDDDAYGKVEAVLRPKVGRLLNDKMPTGVAVSSAMNHGGPYPATSQPYFTAVGFPAAATRFTQLESYDNVRSDRLPACLQNKNPTGRMWRLIDGQWSQGDIEQKAK